MDEKCKAYLKQYLDSLSSSEVVKYTSFNCDYFCADEYNANLCADLVLRGEKTASCSMDYWYTHEGEELPTVGHLQVVTNWFGIPVCIVEVTSVTRCKFSEVTAEFAAAEGEGDKTLDWWRDSHWTFFTSECEQLGICPSEDMVLVLERFKVVWK